MAERANIGSAEVSETCLCQENMQDHRKKYSNTEIWADVQAYDRRMRPAVLGTYLLVECFPSMHMLWLRLRHSCAETTHLTKKSIRHKSLQIFCWTIFYVSFILSLFVTSSFLYYLLFLTSPLFSIYLISVLSMLLEISVRVALG